MTISELYKLYLIHPHVVTDSRQVKQGSMFFALKGENFDGNTFVPAALEAKAAYAVADNEAYRAIPNVIMVDSVLDTLQQLARLHRQTLGIPILAITGSNGKTTTKELVSRVLAKKYKVAVTQGNLNNHIGVPLTLLAMPANTQLGVVEMGTNHFGEIAALCSIAQPNYGLITNVGKAHLEFFGSLEGVERAKGELFDYLSVNGGVPFYNMDSDVLSRMVARRCFKETVAYSRFTLGVQALPMSGEHPFLQLDLASGRTIKTNLLGAYNADNVLAALTLAKCFGVSEDDAVDAIESFVPQNHRSQLIKTASNTICLDAYNANPTSMEAALRGFADLQASDKLLILGDMRELGERSDEEHSRILSLVAQLGFTSLLLVGDCFVKAADGTDYQTFATTYELCVYLQKSHPTGYTILIKGSRGVRLEQTLEYL